MNPSETLGYRTLRGIIDPEGYDFDLKTLFRPLGNAFLGQKKRPQIYGKSAEALCLQACRPTPLILQTIFFEAPKEGLPSPYPLPTGPARWAVRSVGALVTLAICFKTLEISTIFDIGVLPVLSVLSVLSILSVLHADNRAERT